MDIDKVKCNFNIRQLSETEQDIRNIFNNTTLVGVNKENILKYLRAESVVNNTDEIIQLIKRNYNKEQNIIEIKCKLLNERWEHYGNQIFDDLNSQLDLIDKPFDYICKLHLLPLNIIDYENNTIYLNCNDDVDELFKTSVIMLSNIILLQKYIQLQRYKFNTTFTNQNKVWMFVEIAVDALFANSGLYELYGCPSYKYFYNLQINNVNIMEQFRKLYKYIPLNDFLDKVYKFVRENYETISKFKNFLY
ncbi:MAG: hypothetical protein J6Q15_02035 [Clostridia bacterium]|nr:hypothetical protein [Clostridia bacterium]